jgi:hypothetical protein
VLRKYEGRDGRREAMKLIFGNATHKLEARFKNVFEVLSYWRDSASHGQASDISELEAHEALARLLRLSRFVTDNWKDLTGRDAGPVTALIDEERRRNSRSRSSAARCPLIGLKQTMLTQPHLNAVL